jgi:hypothetical protein
MILLTRAGIEEMERSRGAPDQATEHFSPISVIHIQGDAIGSAIQAGGPRAHQTVSIGDLNLDTVREIVGELEAQAASLHLPDDGARQLRADMATVKAQIDVPSAWVSGVGMTAAHRSKNAWISPWPEPAADVLQPARAAQEANPLDSSVNRHLLPAGEDGGSVRLLALVCRVPGSGSR